MIGLDTNVLVRYLLQDTPAQSLRANDLIERRLSASSPGFISVVAVAETVWVLRSVYQVQGAQLVEALKRLLETQSILVEHEPEVYSALRILEDGRGTFADGLIAALGHSAGCTHTFTFDEKATRIPQFQKL